MPGLMRRFGKNAKGATAIEYALIAALIVGILVTAVSILGANVNGLFLAAAAMFP
jgi:pilus assembly protein Flp/PilA